MPQRPTSILTTLAVSLLALTLIAPWVLGQDPDRLAEIRRRAEQGDATAQFDLALMYANGDGVSEDAAEGIVTLIVLGRKGPHGFPFRRPHSHFPIH